ncbi:MAG: BamA/TamA family outer membrane protein [Opitutaceae bacterium]|nr:BamA/TamA family outer membrane protein [Opitutaceae bacterium]
MSRSRLCFLAAFGVAFALSPPSVWAAKIEVHGGGTFRDRELRISLNRLLEAADKETLDANAIEDGAVILTSSLAEQGYQSPVVAIEVTLQDGAPQRFVFDPTFAHPLPRPLAATRVSFRLETGVRSYVDQVEVVGLTALGLKRARAFFRVDNTLLGKQRTNAHSPSRVNRAADGLLGELRQLGYAESDVRATKAAENNGAVTLRVEVREGPRWEVAGVQFQREPEDDVKLTEAAAWIGKPWSPTVEQDLREAIRHAYYEAGYPDVGVHVDAETSARPDGGKAADITATVVSGSRVNVGYVRFEGNTTTKESVLRRRAPLETGDPLNPLAFERARYRISRLGVFETVNLQYEPTDGTTRDAVFTVREGPRYETNLLMGFGSYEQLRGGVEFRQMNILGLAHQSRLELVQSMKSTNVDYTYTVPELFGESLDGTARLFGLQRKEIAFQRQEYGATFSVKRAVRPIHGEASIGYTYQALRIRHNELSTQATDDRQVNVASMTVALTGDTRDNPLRPRRGYHWSTQAEAADPVLGGQSTYQRFEVGGAYHTGWGNGRWVHFGLTHGVLTTLGGVNDDSLPVNKRFFPGGDASIRGYQRGEAAPRDADGLFVGAKTYLLLNFELEQALTPSWSVIAFADALGTATQLASYPFEEKLCSVGLGIRYHTLIGPIRVEYGRNLKRRLGDPSGTWQFSIGYPF